MCGANSLLCGETTSFVLSQGRSSRLLYVMPPPPPDDQSAGRNAQFDMSRGGDPSPRPPPPPTAPTIPDHEMLRRIGQGSYGEVWLARTTLGSYRAVKVVHLDRLKNEREFEREFAGIRRFEPLSRMHDGFVDILQVGRSEAGDWFYYVMELADDAGTGLNPNTPAPAGIGTAAFDPGTYEAKTLSAVIARQGRLPVDECVRAGMALTAALDHLHRHDLIHRDIKPSNIVFVNGQPKLADVSLVVETSEAHSFVGTYGYIPPEGPGSVRADLYALGKVLYAAATGHGATAWPNPPTALYEQTHVKVTGLGRLTAWLNPSSKLEGLPDQEDWLELDKVINTACGSEEGGRRYASAAEMQADLAWLQSGKSLQRQRKREKRLKQAAWALAGAAVLVLSVLFVQQTRLRLATAHQAVLKARLDAEETQKKEAERGVALLQLEQAIRPPHTEGWSSNAWQKASDAAAKFGFDTILQSQAAASLAVLDAKCLFETNGVGGSSVAFDREGKRVLFGSLTENTDDPGKAHLLDLATTSLSAFPVPGEGPVAFLPDGRPVQFSADASHRLALWLAGPVPTRDPQPWPLRQFNLDSGERMATNLVLAVTPNGAFVAASGTNTEGRDFCAVWDSSSGRLAYQTNASATALALAPDGSLLAAGNDLGEVKIWRVSESNSLPTVTAGRLPILSFAFCRNFFRDPLPPAEEPQWLLAVGDSGGGVTIWEVPTQRSRSHAEALHGSEPRWRLARTEPCSPPAGGTQLPFGTRLRGIQ